jgi:uncharacterized membrane protein
VCAFAARTATALVIADLGTLGGTVSFASAVNACSQVVGCATTVGDGTPLGDVTLLRRSLRPDTDGMKALRVEGFNGAKRDTSHGGRCRSRSGAPHAAAGLVMSLR